jgi:putative lipoprotein
MRGSDRLVRSRVDRRACAARGALGLALAAGALLACASPGPQRPVHATLAGTATYRERIALPATARLEVQLVDATNPDAPAPVVAEQIVPAPGQVPIAFSLEYDPKQIEATHVYALRVRVRVGEDIWFASPFDLRVLTGGAPAQQVDVLLDRVSAGGAVSAMAPRDEDPDPPGLDPRVKAVRDEARSIDARLDRLDMREVVENGERLRLWLSGDRPVKLLAAPDTALGRLAPASSYYFRDGALFWVRAPTFGLVLDGNNLVLRTDRHLRPVPSASPEDDRAREARVEQEVQLRLAAFGL